MTVGPSLGLPGPDNGYQNDFVTAVAASFARVTGGFLASAENPQLLGRRVYFGDFALLCHRGDAAAMLNYGNAFALRLWECGWDEFVATPSAATAPREASAARSDMMDRVAKENFVAGYSGTRISNTGRLFRIKDVTIWRLLDARGKAFGVGAVFRDVEYL